MRAGLKEEMNDFWREYRRFAWALGLVILLVYGGRVIHDDFFLDSEIMILNPESMWYLWMGSNRFGMVATSRIFGLHRLSPWISNVLMACTMWCCGITLAFCAREWTGKCRRYRVFTRLFPILFVTAPVFVEQYLFVLQSFEISFGILAAILAAFCSDRFWRSDGFCRGGQSWFWGILGLVLLVWSFGTYQAMVPLYICLVLTAFFLGYLNGKAATALRYALCQVCFFAAGIALYLAAVWVTRRMSGTDSVYVSGMVRWKIDGGSAGLTAIRDSMKNIFMSTSVFYRKYYTPAMVLCLIQACWYGWNKKDGAGNFLWFLLGTALLILSPFYINIVTGSAQPVRTQLVYPITSALFLAHLTVLPEKMPEAAGFLRSGGRALVSAAAAVCVFCGARQGMAAAQLFQTSYEVYRNDVLTAVRMYPDICRVADTDRIQDTAVIFTGGKSAGIKGPAVLGELAGRSMFEAEAHTPVGVSARVGRLFTILGMDMQVVSGDPQLYLRATEYMESAPSWPAQGSIRKMDDIVVVKLSDSTV